MAFTTHQASQNNYICFKEFNYQTLEIASIELLRSDHCSIKKNIWMTFFIWCYVMSNKTKLIRFVYGPPGAMINTSVSALTSSSSYQLERGEEMRKLHRHSWWRPDHLGFLKQSLDIFIGPQQIELHQKLHEEGCIIIWQFIEAVSLRQSHLGRHSPYQTNSLQGNKSYMAQMQKRDDTPKIQDRKYKI